jgi:PAS domain S-box-containing protein
MFACIFEDITERTRAEKTLQEREERSRTIMESTLDAILMIDDEGKISYWNSAAERILGYMSHEAVGRNLHELIAPERFLPAHHAAFPEFRQSGHGEGMGKVHELAARRKDGREIEVSLSLSSMRFKDHWHAIGIVQDITDRKKLEAKNKELAALVNSTDDAITGLDLDRKITVWNGGAEHLFGYSAEEMIGAPSSVLIPPEYEDEARRIDEKIMLGEQITHYETTRLHKDGSRILVSLTVSAIHGPHGEIVGTASTARDVTAQKAMEAQVSRVQRLESLATLAGGVAHQFNNINTVIKGYLELLRFEKGLSAQSSSYVEEALAGVQNAVNITDRLLMLTHPGDSSTTVRLDVLARTVLPVHEKRIQEEKVQLVLELSDTTHVAADESLLKSVLSSLIDNALDSLFGRPVRTLHVRTGSESGGSYFEVEDSGCGIPERNLPKLFMPFYSAKGEWAPTDSPQTRLKGVGLSLAVSSMAVSNYGGRIEVRSIEGVGSTFRVVLPVHAIGH